MQTVSKRAYELAVQPEESDAKTVDSKPDRKRWRMYALSPIPPKLALNAYFVRFKATGDSACIAAFLYHYEPAMNAQLYTYCQEHCCEEHFEDLKQVMAETFWQKAQEYDPSTGAVFLEYIKPYLRDAMREYLRVVAGAFSVSSLRRFRDMQRVNAIYYAALREGASEQTAFDCTIWETGFTRKRITELIMEGTAYRFPVSFDAAEDFDAAEAELCGFDERYFTGCRQLDPQTEYIRMEQWDVIVAAYELLPEKQKRVLCDVCGIACIYGGKTKPSKTYAEIAEDWELYSESAVEKLYKRAVKKLRSGCEVASR